MSLTDMKLKKKSKAELKATEGSLGYEKWPYGLEVTFEKEQIDKLPVIKTFKVGDTVNLSGIGTITRINTSEQQQEKDNYSVGLQLKKVNVHKKKKLEEMTMPEYNKEMERREKGK